MKEHLMTITRTFGLFRFDIISFHCMVWQGPLSLGLFMWPNSLVFSSHSKLTTTFIHSVPSEGVEGEGKEKGKMGEVG